MLKKILTTLIITIAMTLVAGCSFKKYDGEILHEKGVNLTKITAKVKVAIKRKIKDENLLIYIQKKYPSEISAFSDYHMDMKNDNGTAVVLLCDKEKTQALLEDLSCTGALEGGYIFRNNLPCDYHLDIKRECVKTRDK